MSEENQESENHEQMMKELADAVPSLPQETREKIESLVQQIEYVPIDSIRPSDNPGRLIKDGIPKVAESIRKTGFRSPIYVSGDEIVIGHTRWFAAKLLTLTTVPVVRINDLSEDEIRLLRLADNRVAEFSTWDFTELGKEVGELRVEMPDMDFSSLGFYDALGLDWDDGNADDLDGYQEPDDHVLICPTCGFKAGGSFFKKPDGEDGGDDGEGNEPSGEADEAKDREPSKKKVNIPPSKEDRDDLLSPSMGVSPLTDEERAAVEALSEQIQYLGISDIRPSANKARRILKGIPKVAASIRTLGFRSPIIVDGTKGNEIIAGHTRYFAAKLLGLTKVPVVIVTDLSPSLVKVLRLADNRTSEFSTWEFDALNAELDYLERSLPDINLDSLGFFRGTALRWDSEPHHSASSGGPSKLQCPKCGYIGDRSEFLHKHGDKGEAETEDTSSKEN